MDGGSYRPDKTMETPKQFDLNEAIGDWRAECERTQAMKRDDVAELEEHLRDSVRRLSTAQLSEEEAFVIATRRLGKPAVLETEYAKLNVSQVWLRRAFWMIAGLVVNGLVQAGIFMPVQLMAWLCAKVEVEITSARWGMGLISLLIITGFVLLAVRLVKRNAITGARAAMWFERHPWLMGGALLLAAFAPHFARVYSGMFVARNVQARYYGAMATTEQVIFVCFGTAVYIGWVCLAAYFLRQRNKLGRV